MAPGTHSPTFVSDAGTHQISWTGSYGTGKPTRPGRNISFGDITTYEIKSHQDDEHSLSTPDTPLSPLSAVSGPDSPPIQKKQAPSCATVENNLCDDYDFRFQRASEERRSRRSVTANKGVRQNAPELAIAESPLWQRRTSPSSDEADDSPTDHESADKPINRASNSKRPSSGGAVGTPADHASVVEWQP